MTKTLLTAVAGLVLGATVPAAAQDFEWSGRIRAGQTVEIKGVNGEIRAELASGEQVQVTARKTARRDDPSEVEIKVVEHAGGVTICAVYPEGRRDRRPNVCAPGDEGRLNSDDNDVAVHFTVRVPAGVRLAAQTVNGGVRATGLRADVEARTVNGDVRVSTTGRALAGTVNGSIDARMGRADWEGGAEFSTVNGSITLELPSEVNAQLRASTVNGDIETDFPVTVQGRFGPRKVTGTLGRGGPELELSTVNGSITLRKAS